MEKKVYQTVFGIVDCKDSSFVLFFLLKVTILIIFNYEIFGVDMNKKNIVYERPQT